MFSNPVTMVVANGIRVLRFSGARRSEGLLSWPFLLDVKARIKGRPDCNEK